jgi:urease accessory protein
MSRFHSLRRLIPWIVGAAAAAMSGAAAAHTGHGTHGLLEGLAHPVSGADHLLAMLAVGLWAAVALPQGRRWQAPALFVAVMAAAATLAGLGIAVPTGLETAIAASVVLLGGLLIGGQRVAAPAGLALVAVSAALHGAAHGLEMAPATSALAYGTGFVAATAAWHAVGLIAGGGLRRLGGAAQAAAGSLVGAGGLLMLLARI